MKELETRRLGRTEMRPRALGLGCAWFGSPGSSDREATDGVRHAIDLGINFIDTSPSYGESERRLGRALAAGYREKVYLQSKSGTHPARPGDFSSKGTRWSVENSLRLLGTDYLDSCLIHDPADIGAPLAPGHALEELLRMKEEGLVRHIGLGARNHEMHRRAIETGRMDILLSYLDYTLLDQSAAETILPLARGRDVGVILASPLGMGRLAGPEPDARTDPRAHAMWQWCRDRGVSLRHLALQFCLAAPIDGIVLYGPANRKEVLEGYEAATEEIPVEIWRDFSKTFGVVQQ